MLSDGGTLIPRGALLARSGRIVAVGPRADFPRSPDYPETRFERLALAPGLVNAHAHLEYACCAGRLEPGRFLEWLPRTIALKRSLGPGEITTGVGEAIQQLAAQGVTTVADTSTFGVSPALLSASGLRHVVFREALSMTETLPWDGWIDSFEGRLSDDSGDDLASAGVAPHAPYTVSLPLMRALRENFSRVAPFSIHVAECRSELVCLARRRGALARMLRRAEFYPSKSSGVEPSLARSPIEFLKAGLPEGEKTKRDLLIHGNFLTLDEMKELAREGRSSLVICPGARLFHGVVTPVLSRALRARLPVALGTDSPVSNDALDMWVEMRRSLAMAPRRASWRASDAWRAATEGGAWALGLEDEIGTLKPGFRADFMAVAPPESPEDGDVEKWLDGWIQAAIPPVVQGTWVDGREVFNALSHENK